MNYAGFWKRVAAFVIDAIIVTIGFFLVILWFGIMFGSATLNTAAWERMGSFVGFILMWLYFALMESSPKQGTLGKMALGIKVVELNGNKIGFGKASGRYFGKIISSILCVGYIMVAFTQKKQGFHDKMAGCLVVGRALEVATTDDAAIGKMCREAEARGVEEARKKTTYPIPNAMPSNLAAVEKDKVELGKSADSDVSRLKKKGIIHVQDISHSGSLLQAEMRPSDKTLLTDEAFYEQAFKELESEDRKVGLWAKVFAEAQGNETLAKANYLKIRSGQLANEYKQSLLEDERRRQEEKKMVEKELRRLEEIEKVAKKLEEERRLTIQESLLAEECTNPFLNARFCLIRSGTFMMGSPTDESGRNDNETQHLVTISKSFYMQDTPVTQEQWQKVMGSNPAEFKNVGDHCPVERVSWDDVQEFIRKLNSMEVSDKYRLPTEAEWEYACRAGSATAYCFGNDPSQLDEYAWYMENSFTTFPGGISENAWYLETSGRSTHPVGQKKPNAWGLYDMHGNVWEWCLDLYGEYRPGNVTDPQILQWGDHRLKVCDRGGSWLSYAVLCRSANRDTNTPGIFGHSLGFRLVRTC